MQNSVVVFCQIRIHANFPNGECIKQTLRLIGESVDWKIYAEVKVSSRNRGK